MNKQETFTLENQVFYIQEYLRLGGIYTGRGANDLGWIKGEFNPLEDMHYDFCILVSDSFWELGLEADELHWLLCWYGLGYDKVAKYHDYLRLGVARTPQMKRSHTQFPFRRGDRIKRFCRTYPFEKDERDIECQTTEMLTDIADKVRSQTEGIVKSIDWNAGYRDTQSIYPIQPNGVCRWDTLGGIKDHEDYLTSPYPLTTYDWRRRIQLENKLGFRPPNLPIYDCRTDYDLLTKNTLKNKTLKEARRYFYGNKYNHYGGDNSVKRKRNKRKR